MQVFGQCLNHIYIYIRYIILHNHSYHDTPLKYTSINIKHFQATDQASSGSMQISGPELPTALPELGQPAWSKIHGYKV